MIIDELKDARDAMPFYPFTIHMANGRAFRVIHRDYFWLPPGDRIAIFHPVDSGTHILDILLMTEIAVESPPIENEFSRASS